MILLFLNHVVLSVLLLYGVIDYSPSIQQTGRRLFYPLVLHIIISCYLHIKDKMRKNKVYSKLISETTQQFVTGIAIAVFAGLHILLNMMFPANSYSGFNYRLLHSVIDILMFVSISLHLRVSIPRFAVSLGFLENKNSYSKFKHRFNIIVFVMLFIAILAEFTGYWVIL